MTASSPKPRYLRVARSRIEASYIYVYFVSWIRFLLSIVPSIVREVHSVVWRLCLDQLVLGLFINSLFSVVELYL